MKFENREQIDSGVIKFYLGSRISIAKCLACLLRVPADPGSIPSVPKKISEEKIVNVAVVN